MPIRLGQLEIHPELNEISGPAGRQRLEPQAMTVLELLVEGVGRAWPREELLERAWPGRVVSDATLTGVVSRLRRALHDAGIEDVRIETRSKRGYVLQRVEQARETAGRKGGLPLRGAALFVALVVAASVAWPWLSEPRLESLDGVRLAFDVTFPDGTRARPVILLEDGADGEIRLGGEHPLSVRVVPALADNGLLRLRFEAAGLSHWTGFEQVIGLNTESRFTVRGREAGATYDIRFVASPGNPPPQEIRR